MSPVSKNTVDRDTRDRPKKMNETHSEQTGSFKRIPSIGDLHPADVEDRSDELAEDAKKRRDWDPYQVWRSRIRRS